MGRKQIVKNEGGYRNMQVVEKLNVLIESEEGNLQQQCTVAEISDSSAVLQYAQSTVLHSQKDREICKSNLCESLRIDPPPQRNIEHIDFADLTDEDFQQRFVSFSHPVIISGLADEWRAAERWASGSDLIHHYGNVPVSNYELQDERTLHAPLCEYIQYALENDVDNPVYVFENDFTGPRAAFLEDFVVPEYFARSRDLFENARWLCPNFQYFLIGGERTGSKMHVDPKFTCAWNTSLCGMKRWVLLPPHTFAEVAGATSSSRDTSEPPAYWWQDVYPRLCADAKRLGMIECLQMPGETIFVPEGWWHVVLNVSPLTVAITQNLLLPIMLPLVLPDICQRWPHFGKACTEFLQDPKAGFPDMEDQDNRDDVC